MNIENIRQFIKEKAEQFGAKTENEFNKPYVERNNTGQEALKDNGAYFGFIHPEEEEASGPKRAPAQSLNAAGVHKLSSLLYSTPSRQAQQRQEFPELSRRPLFAPE